MKNKSIPTSKTNKIEEIQNNIEELTKRINQLIILEQNKLKKALNQQSHQQ